jgi:hypothetical protein
MISTRPLLRLIGVSDLVPRHTTRVVRRADGLQLRPTHPPPVSASTTGDAGGRRCRARRPPQVSLVVPRETIRIRVDVRWVPR